jgi:predicted nucleotidyltransferase component of viral defense system
MTLNYPLTFSSIREWCNTSGTPVSEGRVRFAQYAILHAIASSQALSKVLVFKGGNALDFIWQPNRSTRDLDFSADMTMIEPNLDPIKFGESVKNFLQTSLVVAREQLDVRCAVYSVRKNPRAPGSTFVTFDISLGYALPDQATLIKRMSLNIQHAQTIPVEISLNEPICADESIDVHATNTLRVSTIEDIVAEKLRALLQQPIRNRTRRQDLLDIAVILQEQPAIDHSLIADFLQRKSAARDVPVSRSAFHDPEIARRAASDYDALQQTTRKLFIPFEEALRNVLEFTDSLPIPEDTPTDQETS